MAKGFLGIDWWKVRDDVFFGGAEQKTNEEQYQSEVHDYIEHYDGPIETYTNDHTYVGTCACGCGGTVACNFAELAGGFRIKESCATELLKRRGQENLDPWDWHRKPPVRLG